MQTKGSTEHLSCKLGGSGVCAGRGRQRVFCSFSNSLLCLVQSPHSHPGRSGRFGVWAAFAQQMLECKHISSGCRCLMQALQLSHNDLHLNWWNSKPWICFSSQQGRNLAESQPVHQACFLLPLFSSSCSYFFMGFFFPLPPLPDFSTVDFFGKIPDFEVEEKHVNAPHLTRWNRPAQQLLVGAVLVQPDTGLLAHIWVTQAVSCENGNTVKSGTKCKNNNAISPSESWSCGSYSSWSNAHGKTQKRESSEFVNSL